MRGVSLLFDCFKPFLVILGEILEKAGVPPGVFNLVQGAGPVVGVALSSHPNVDMISFTGSTRAGIDVAIRAAPTVKRVSQELGGKSANILLDDEQVIFWRLLLLEGSVLL